MQWPGRPVTGQEAERLKDKGPSWPGRRLSDNEARVLASEGDVLQSPRATDGDTVRDGDTRIRMVGMDAPELRQQGWDRQGNPVPIGEQSRDFLTDTLGNGPVTVGPSFGTSYGRQVAPIRVGTDDAGLASIRYGQGFAAPEYLVEDPARRSAYVQAERLARLNGLGVHDTFAQSPAEHRANPDYVPERETIAQFFDTPTPLQGLRPEQEQEYLRLLNGTGTANEILSYVRGLGFDMREDEVRKSVAWRDEERAAGREPDWGVRYERGPRLEIDGGGGSLGATVRGAGGGLLAGGADEVGAIIDTLGGTPGRESIWNSDRRVADIWANNQYQNAATLDYDQNHHPIASTVGEVAGALASGLIIPWGAGARTVPQLAKVGAAYGAAEGFLGTDGTTVDRAKGAVIGAPIGAAFNSVAGKALEYGAPIVAKGLRFVTRRNADKGARAAGEVAEGYGNGEALEAGLEAAADVPRRSGADAPRFDPEAVSRAQADWPETVRAMEAGETDLVEGAIYHPELGHVDMRWGEPGNPANEFQGGYGLSHIIAKHGQEGIVPDLPERIAGMRVANVDAQQERIQLEGPGGRAALATTWHGDEQRWVVTAFDPNWKSPPGETPTPSPIDAGPDSALRGDGGDIPQLGDGSNTPAMEWPGRPLTPPETRAMEMPDKSISAYPASWADGPVRTDDSSIAPPPSAYSSAEEAQAAQASRWEKVMPPKEGQLLNRRIITNYRGQKVPKVGPLDLVGYLRSRGGLQNQGGELRHSGINNRVRKGMDLVGQEGRLGPLVHPEGMTFDDAALDAWEEGYFPELSDRPTIDEFLDALRETYNDGARRFRVDDFPEVEGYYSAKDERINLEEKIANFGRVDADRSRPAGMRESDPISSYETPVNRALNLTELAGYEPTWRGRMAERFDNFRTAMQDRHVPLLRVQRAIERATGQPLADELNPYLGEELMTGRIGAELEKLNEDRIRPLLDDMADRGVTVKEMDAYLYARHAPERNAAMAEINPRFADGGGSGMTDQQAGAIMSWLDRNGKLADVEALAKRVDDIRDKALQKRLDGGLMTEADAADWRGRYPNYVPLKGSADDSLPGASISTGGSGITVRGKESKRALGRESQADSPLANTLLQAEEAINRAETNRVAQRLLSLAEANPDPNFWTINKVATKRRIDPETGQVEDYSVRQLLAEDAPYTISAKVDGEEVRLTFNRNNPVAKGMASSLRRLTEQQMDWFTQHFGKVNRFLSAVNTSYNPEFIISNMVRDLQTAAINLQNVPVDRIASGTLKDYRKALMATTKGAFRKGGGEWRDWYEQFIADGGRVYFNRIDNVDAIRKRIQREFRISSARAGKGNAAAHIERGLLGVRDLVENINLGVENAVRLAAYKNARQAGVSRDKAASIAKNLTVNFNRRGTAGPAMNAFYMFYNASVQGSVRILQAAKSPRVQKILAGIAVAGSANEFQNAMVSAVDEDGQSFYDKIPAYEKSRNLIFMLPDGRRYLKIPSPWGYNVFWEAGRSASELARRGGENWEETAANFLTTAVDAFNPIGGTDSLLKAAIPTLGDPFLEIATNKNFAGSPIMPESNPFQPDPPDHRRYFDSVAPQWKLLADTLNIGTGGSEVEPGAVSISPETMEHLFGFVTGGAGRFLDSNVALLDSARKGEEIELNQVPIVRRVVGEKPGWIDRSTFYDRMNQVEQMIAYREEYAERGLMDRKARFDADNADILGLADDVKAAKKSMKAIRKERKELASGDKEGAAALDAREAEVVREFNTTWNGRRGRGNRNSKSERPGAKSAPEGSEAKWPGRPVTEGEMKDPAVQWPGRKLDQPDYVGKLEAAGLKVTSGYRTPEYQEDMRRRGYKPARNSRHLDGSAIDIAIGRGQSPLNAIRTLRRELPDNITILNEGDHLHVTIPGWFAAPAIGGAAQAGLRNPVEAG